MNHFRLDKHSLGLQTLRHLGGADRAVKVAFVVGVDLDGDAGHLGDLLGQGFQIGNARRASLR